MGRQEFENLVVEHRSNAAERLLQKTLAREVTTFVHGAEEYEKAVATTEKLFANQTAPAESLSAEDLEGMEGVVKFDFSAEKIRAGIDVVSFLAEASIFPSKGEARKMVQQGGVSINRHKVTDVGTKVVEEMLLHGRYILVQKGKKNYYLVSVRG